ncbi:MAG: helix-turn-helix transcriptional regulator [Firmicutes bacterium]|nr:helix-turn-helix transcriptional regulator [Bacillota bacterium]
MYSRNELGANVKKARQKRAARSGEDFSQKNLAVKIGETVKWVKKLERGEFYPDWDALNFIADVCGVDLEILIGEKFKDEVDYQDAVKGGEVSRTLDDNVLTI